MSELKELAKDRQAEVKVDITGLKCPVPLIMLRRTVIKAQKGDIIEFSGTKDEEISRKEIIMAVENLKQELLVNEDVSSTGRWIVRIRKK